MSNIPDQDIKKQLESVTRISGLLKGPFVINKETGASYVREVAPHFLEWREIPWRSDHLDCRDPEDNGEDAHTGTICPECLGSWSLDFWLRVYSGETLVIDTQVYTELEAKLAKRLTIHTLSSVIGATGEVEPSAFAERTANINKLLETKEFRCEHLKPLETWPYVERCTESALYMARRRVWNSSDPEVLRVCALHVAGAQASWPLRAGVSE